VVCGHNKPSDIFNSIALHSLYVFRHQKEMSREGQKGPRLPDRPIVPVEIRAGSRT